MDERESQLSSLIFWGVCVYVQMGSATITALSWVYGLQSRELAISEVQKNA